MAMRWNVRRVLRNEIVVPDFPDADNREACNEWEPHVAVFALAHSVIAVANTRVEGCWKAYIDAVPGKNHDEEWQNVRRHGVTIPHDIAKAMFPGFAAIPYHSKEIER